MKHLQYSYELGVEDAKGGSNNGTAKPSDPDSPSSVMNLSAYQSAQALASQTQGRATRQNQLSLQMQHLPQRRQ